MRIPQLWQISICVAVFAIPAIGYAQTTTPISSAPPKLEQLDEDIPDALKKQNPNLKPTGKPEAKPKITEKREQGKVTEVKVGTGKSAYIVKPNNQPGSGLPGDVQSNQVRGAQWSVKEFDLGQKKKQAKKDGEADAPPPAAQSAPPLTPSK